MEHMACPRVEEALARLATLDARPVEEHPPVYDAVHRLLQDALADLDPLSVDPGDRDGT
jgi:hypothetical protein